MSTRAAHAVRPPMDDTNLGSEEWVHRFGLTERFAHWWTVSMVAAALLTGLALGDEAESGPMPTAHVGAVVLIGAGLLLALVLGNTRALLTAAFHLFTVDRRDAAWVRVHLSPSGARSDAGEWGVFNPGQKALAWALTLAVSFVIYTGIQAWNAGEGEGSLHGASVVVAMVNPSTRPALAGMVLGRVRRSWAEQHHGGWLHDHDRDRHESAR